MSDATDEREWTKVCPHCDDGNEIYVRADASARSRWRCRTCGEEFETPLTRKRKNSGAGSEPTGGNALLAADPDEWP